MAQAWDRLKARNWLIDYYQTDNFDKKNKELLILKKEKLKTLAECYERSKNGKSLPYFFKNTKVTFIVLS